MKECFERVYKDFDDITLSKYKVDNDVALHDKDENNDKPSYDMPDDNVTDAPTEVIPYNCVINEITEKDLADPVEILKYLQQRLNRGKLDVAIATFDLFYLILKIPKMPQIIIRLWKHFKKQD